MSAGRIIAVVVGALLALFGLGAGAAAGGLVVAHTTARDSDGFYTTGVERFETSTVALVGSAELREGGPLGEVRVRVTGADRGPVFVGIGPRDQVEDWLAGTAYERLLSVPYGPFRAETELVAGDRVIDPPAEQDFWVAAEAGAGTRTLTWTPRAGEWSLVVMNQDAAPGVAVDASVGAGVDLALPVALGLGAAALVLLAAGLAIMLVAVTGRGGTGAGAGPGAGPVEGAGTGTPPAAGPGAGQGPSSDQDQYGDQYGLAGGGGVVKVYPVKLDANLDQPLSRWLWLVKWFLAIPHVVVLWFLWLAFWLLTLVAGVAILITGRYPRPIFDFNVGVMRWTWRVSYYAFGVLGTDRYPPFRLEPDPRYPADLAVAYPRRLSRGLVLVKWWLLAIPHYLVVALFAGGWSQLGWTAGDGRWRFTAGFGLIGILVLVAVVVLAVTGRYPPALFDFILGMQRWVFRVLAYAALMRDEYPPFRLDAGGTDPGSALVPSGPPPGAGGQRGGQELVGAQR